MNESLISKSENGRKNNYDLVCFSHLRWDFVFQRPQHLFTRFSKIYRVFFIEEPKFHSGVSTCETRKINNNLFVVTPYLEGSTMEERENDLKELIENYFQFYISDNYIFWYYTPMALSYTDQLHPALIVYDCMDELSAFKFAPPRLNEMEKELFEKADLVFTGGVSLYQHKKKLHRNIYPFPSSIDKEHFIRARSIFKDPLDQASIPHPRFGFYGVVDERFDIALIENVASAKPDWHFIILGPIVKIDPKSLPRYENIHYISGKSYDELPEYLAGWDIAIIPFARNESTRYISPTKTPEYLAAGKQVISTSIPDVVDPYAKKGLVHIADEPEKFIQTAEAILSTNDQSAWLESVDDFLQNISWDKTWMAMMQLMQSSIAKKKINNILKTKEAYV